jgi:hypothetical protein
MPKEKDTKAAELLGWPAKLINQIVKGKEDREWVQEKITKGGPPHKQLQHTLVLSRLEHLAALMKARHNLGIKIAKSREITAEDHKSTLPVGVPEASITAIADNEKALEQMMKGPEHEILYTALLLQIIENMITAEEQGE